MLTIQHICDFLAEFAPPVLAEDWDNVGLLIGDPSRQAQRIMTCLTVTPESAEEAVQNRADLIVSHHPFPFRSLKQITTHTTVGRLLLQLISAGIAVHSPHTAFDSAAAGINQRLADGLGLKETVPLIPATQLPGVGTGRRGTLAPPITLAELAARVQTLLRVSGLQFVGERNRTVKSVAIACGSAGQMLAAAQEAGCDVFVTGETSFHTCLEAQANGVALLLPGHFASERFAVEQLADVLVAQFPSANIWPSRSEKDPLEWL